MAGYNELLVGRYNRYLQKLLQMKGKASLESLNPELHVTLETFHGMENRVLEGWTRYAIIGIAPAVAAVTSAVELRLPTQPVVAVIESINWSQDGFLNTAVKWSVQNFATDLTTVVTPGRMDQRQPSNSSVAIFSVGTAAVTSAGQGSQAGISGEFIKTTNQEIPLVGVSATGLNTIIVASGTVNQAISIGITWRERFLEEAERTG